MMHKIVRLTYHRCDRDALIKLQSSDRYALLDYVTLAESPDECIDEVIEFFTCGVDYYYSDDPDYVESVPGPRFSKRGLKELKETIYALREELLNEKPNHVTDELSGIYSDVQNNDPLLE